MNKEINMGDLHPIIKKAIKKGRRKVEFENRLKQFKKVKECATHTDYSDLSKLGFNGELFECSVFKNQYGVDGLNISVEIVKNVSFWWTSGDRQIIAYHSKKNGDIITKKDVDINGLKEVLDIFEYAYNKGYSGTCIGY